MRKLFRRNRVEPLPQLVRQPRLAANGNCQPAISILTLAWPVVLEMALHTFVWIFDTAMVMRLGAREASAVEFGALVLFNLMAVFGALGIGVNALVARYTGAGEMDKAARTGGQALSLALLIAAGFAAVGYLCGRPFFTGIIRDDLTAMLTVDYFYTILLSGGFMYLIILVANGIIRGTGNTRVPMLILAASLYIAGDYLLISGITVFRRWRESSPGYRFGPVLGAILSGYLFHHTGSCPFMACMFPLHWQEGPVLRLSILPGQKS